MNFLSGWRWRKSVAGAGSAYVTEKFGVRSLHIGSDTIQSSMRLSRPYDLELAYTRSMMAVLLFQPEPKRVLIVGLGGGSLAKFVHHRMPGAVTEVLEINPDVVSIARLYFEVPPSDDRRFTIRVCDGADFIARDGAGYDLILVDGYDGDSLVKNLSSSAFFSACRRRLNARGALSINLWGSDSKFNEYVERIEGAFPAGTLCLPAEKPGNVATFAFRDPPANLRWAELDTHAQELESRYGLEFGRFVRGLRKMNRCDDERLYVTGET